MASVEIWLPDGRYTDIFTREVYRGGKTVVQRDITTIPVIAPAGAIIPLDGKTSGNDCGNPEFLEILIYKGNGSFKLYEDDGETLAYKDGHCVETEFKLEENGSELKFTVSPADGDLSLIPSGRKYIFSFRDVAAAEKISVVSNGEAVDYTAEKKDGGLSLTVERVSSDKGIVITLFAGKGKI